ncbi:winged helix-turn-helix transcriptional regulator [Dyadobacter frigoris]|uniref:winged helix-turn-helix transcriptional regulator n=1 Tax=Dyadobacter frigoris TaxID=2576211 RepID=UPI001E3C767C|nr:winged helix-turn-helix transcriptional regulator [Dyadobacter frigoris]
MHKKIPEATRRVLNIQLRQLELHNIISKEVFPQLPLKVEYSLTEFGKTLLPVIETM